MGDLIFYLSKHSSSPLGGGENWGEKKEEEKRQNGTNDMSPPQEFVWEIGKTAASILFVREAERYLLTCEDSKNIVKLQEKIDRIKNGEEELMQELHVEEFLCSC